MLNKIFNWSFGAFFRTIGRILAYLVIGILILIIGSLLGSKLPKNIFMKVNAATTNGEYIPKMYSNSNLTTEYTFDYNKGGYYTEFYNNFENKEWYFQPIIFETNKYSTLFVPVTISDPNSILSITRNNTNTDIIKELGASVSIRAIWNDGWLSWCYSTDINKNNNSVVYQCNVPNTRTSLMGLNIHIADTSIGASILESVVTVGIADTFDFEISSNKTNEDIKNSINDINDTINDTSNPDTDSAISSWTDKMIDNPLADVILLPLTVLNSFKTALEGKCIPLELTVPFIDYDVNIPCISSIFAQIDGLVPLWNSIGTIVSAVMLYQYLIYLYNWIDDTISLKTKRMQGWGSV